MVRYFINRYEDYTPGAPLNTTNEDLILKINEYIVNIVKRLRPTSKSVSGGLYVGCTGVAYMFYRLSKNVQLTDHKSDYLKKGIEYVSPALVTPAGDTTSFLLGDAGSYALGAVLHKNQPGTLSADLLKKYQSLYHIYMNPKFLKCGGDEFFVGRTGYIAGGLWLNREFQSPVFAKSDMYKMCDLIVESGRDYAKTHNSSFPLMYHYYNTEYLGSAHGLCFILQMLLTVPGYIEHNVSAAADIKASVETLASLQTSEGNWPCCMEEVGLNDHKLVHWCHGAPGVVYLMAKAYLVYKEERYLNACKRAAEVIWYKGLLKKGPGICHGVAGNGYVFLLLYRLTRDNVYLHRASTFADFMHTDEFLKEARVPDSPESLYEGTAGTVCFLADLLNPDQAEFPFQDVFIDYSEYFNTETPPQPTLAN